MNAKLVGWLSVLEHTFWGFPLFFALLHLFPPLRLLATMVDAKEETNLNCNKITDNTAPN